MDTYIALTVILLALVGYWLRQTRRLGIDSGRHGSYPICSSQFATLEPYFECRRDVKRHLFQDRVVASKGWIDYGEIPLVS